LTRAGKEHDGGDESGKVPPIIALVRIIKNGATRCGAVGSAAFIEFTADGLWVALFLEKFIARHHPKESF
jgi:hypothetical protein